MAIANKRRGRWSIVGFRECDRSRWKKLDGMGVKKVAVKLEDEFGKPFVDFVKQHKSTGAAADFDIRGQFGARAR